MLLQSRCFHSLLNMKELSLTETEDFCIWVSLLQLLVVCACCCPAGPDESTSLCLVLSQRARAPSWFLLQRGPSTQLRFSFAKKNLTLWLICCVVALREGTRKWALRLSCFDIYLDDCVVKPCLGCPYNESSGWNGPQWQMVFILFCPHISSLLSVK